MSHRCLLVLLIAIGDAGIGGTAPRLGEQPVYCPTIVGTTLVYEIDASTDVTKTFVVTAVKEDKKGTVVEIGWDFMGRLVPYEVVQITAEGMKSGSPTSKVSATWVLRFPVVVGDKWEVKGVFLMSDVIVTHTVRGYETVKVPAGEFKSIRIDTELTVFEKPVRTSRWYAANVGIVKEDGFVKSQLRSVRVVKK